MYMSSNSRPLVAVTSSVCGLASFGGGRSPAFQDKSMLLVVERELDEDGLVACDMVREGGMDDFGMGGGV